MMRHALSLSSLLLMSTVLRAQDVNPCAPPAPVVIAFQGQISGCSSANGVECYQAELIAFNAATFGSSLTSCAVVEWDLGDGTIATGRRVQHLYATSGVYPISVRVTTPSGTRVAEGQVFATGVLEERIAFVAERTPKERWYRFVVAAAEGSGEWIWDFGDGTTVRTRERVATHFFRAGGTYTVKLSSANRGEVYEQTVIVPSGRRRASQH